MVSIWVLDSRSVWKDILLSSDRITDNSSDVRSKCCRVGGQDELGVDGGGGGGGGQRGYFLLCSF